MSGHACTSTAESNTAGGDMCRVGLQTASIQAEETSCTTCFCLLQSRTSLHSCGAQRCTMESFLRLSSFPTSASCTAMFWFQWEGRLNTPRLGAVVSDTVHARLGQVTSTPHWFCVRVNRNRARDHLFRQTWAQIDACVHSNQNRNRILEPTVLRSGPRVWEHCQLYLGLTLYWDSTPFFPPLYLCPPLLSRNVSLILNSIMELLDPPSTKQGSLSLIYHLRALIRKKEKGLFGPCPYAQRNILNAHYFQPKNPCRHQQYLRIILPTSKHICKLSSDVKRTWNL